MDGSWDGYVDNILHLLAVKHGHCPNLEYTEWAEEGRGENMDDVDLRLFNIQLPVQGMAS